MLGEERATDSFEAFVVSIEARLRQALSATLGSEPGREAAADALAYAWEHWDRIRDMENPAGYLYVVGRDKGRRAAKRHRRVVLMPVDSGHLPWVEPALPGAVAALPEQQRMVVMLLHCFQWTMSEVAETVSNIRERVDIALVVDGDTGFGNALNVQRTVRLLERMGASAVQLEDQTMPKRCGHLDGKALVSVGEMVGKIKAALDARESEDTLIVARTDAITVSGIDDALERGVAYMNAGADVLFIESPLDDTQLAQIGQVLGARVPLLANMVEGGKTPLHSAAELGKFGYRLVIFPGAMVRVVSRAASGYLQELKRTGSTRDLLGQMFNFDQVNEILGTVGLLDKGKRYEE